MAPSPRIRSSPSGIGQADPVWTFGLIQRDRNSVLLGSSRPGIKPSRIVMPLVYHDHHRVYANSEPVFRFTSFEEYEIVLDHLKTDLDAVMERRPRIRDRAGLTGPAEGAP